MKHLSIQVYGKVQGVFFRASAKEAAEQYTITGFAQNLPDGRVYIEAEGMTEKLEEFVKWCHTGPPRAVVTRVEVHAGIVKNFDRFEIRR